MKTVAVGIAAGRNPQHMTRDNIAGKQQDHPMHGANKFLLTGTPTHALGNGQAVEGALDHGDKQLGGRSARLVLTHDQPGTLGGFFPLYRGHIDPAGTGKAQGGGSRLALSIKGGLYRGSLAYQFLVWLGCRQGLNPHRQPAGSGKAFDSVEAQLVLSELRGETIRQGRGKPVQSGRGQFLGSNFK